jgi:hypothetical protein
MDAMPQLNVRLSKAGEARLARLNTMLGLGKTALVERALVHLLATLERGEKANLTIPSELEQQNESKESPRQ